MTALDRLRASARANPRRIVLAEGEDVRIATAAVTIAEQGIAEPVLLGREGVVRSHIGNAAIETVDRHLPELLARIRALIRRSAGHPSATARFGDVEIDFNARRVTRDGVEVALTAREYSLVSMLAQHRDRVFTRAQLYEHLFDEMDESSSNLLDVHVSNVRKKLGKEFIVTRRGHGYCIRTSSAP